MNQKVYAYEPSKSKFGINKQIKLLEAINNNLISLIGLIADTNEKEMIEVVYIESDDN